MSILPDISIGDVGNNLKSIGRGLKDGIVGIFQSEWEKKVLDVTTNDKEIQDSEVINDICNATNSRSNYEEIMNKVMERLDQDPDDWKIIYKALLLIDHLLRKGSKRCVDDFKSNRRAFKRLFNFDYFDENQNDCGVNIREKSRSICDLLDNDEALKDSRAEAKVSKNKYEGEGHSVNPQNSSSSIAQSLGNFFGFSSSSKSSYSKKNQSSYYNDDDDDDEEDNKYSSRRSSTSTSLKAKQNSDLYESSSQGNPYFNDPYSSSSTSSTSSSSSSPSSSKTAGSVTASRDPYFTPPAATTAPATAAPNAFSAFSSSPAAPSYNRPPPPAAPALDPFAVLAANSNNGQTAAASNAFFSNIPAAAPAPAPAPAAAFNWGAPTPAAQPVVSNNFFSTAPAPAPAPAPAVTHDFFSTMSVAPQPAQVAPAQQSFFSAFPQAQQAAQPVPVQQPAVPAAFSFFLEQNAGANAPATSTSTSAAPTSNADSLFGSLSAPSSNTSSNASFDHLFDLSSLGGKKEEEKKGPAFSPSTAPPPNIYAAYKW